MDVAWACVEDCPPCPLSPLEEFTMLHDGKAMDCAAYCCTTFIVGCLLAYVGAHVGLRFAGTEHNDGDRHAMGKEAD